MNRILQPQQRRVQQGMPTSLEADSPLFNHRNSIVRSKLLHKQPHRVS